MYYKILIMTKAAFSLKLDEKIMERVRKQAQIEHRAVNNFIETVLIKYLDAIENEQQKTPGE